MADHSVKDTAAMLGVGVSWLYARAAASEVPHQRYYRGRIAFTDAQIEQIRKQYEQPVITPRRLRRAS